MIFCCGSVDRSNLLTPSSEAVKRTTASISSCMGRTAGSLQPMQSCWSPAPVSYHGGSGCAPDSRLRLVHTSASSFSVRFKSPSGRGCRVFIDTPQKQIAQREQPCRTALPDTLCAAFLATGDFDTFTGELFRFHDEFYVELLPHQYNSTVNTAMQYTHSQMRCQLVVFMILYYEAEYFRQAILIRYST